jgi:hypothetical protein
MKAGGVGKNAFNASGGVGMVRKQFSSKINMFTSDSFNKKTVPVGIKRKEIQTSKKLNIKRGVLIPSAQD